MHPPLLSNYRQAELRLNSLSRKFDKNPQLGEKYNAIISGYEQKGFIEEVPESEIDFDKESTGGKNVYYMPHHPVFNPNSTSTPIRPVFDASAKGPLGTSLNVSS